jgi:hypothetical protein
MAYLHYGADVRIQLDKAATKHVMESVSNHATRGGWVTATDTTGDVWVLLVSAGIPIWITESK